ncbi:hypothetical protein K3162_07595 [Qipengyuania xiapuensis]|uniref:Uncharacterized protein n=1 Tax=Qipengyuania xiapuensis TaxID=2867236 RepID=A0ABX8ZQZ7_9SPHN|nr:hypothetical protein [Qipengyuania xiapuensis]QZD91440.1 hypothetical protein K3162_07595 [Qipengyuania xiapuensis]
MSDDWTDQGMASKRWFKPAVAVWFALLLGGGLFLMPSTIHASIAQATGIAGRLLVSAIVGIFGLMLGWAIASRIAQATAPRAIAPGLEPHEAGDWDDGEVMEEEPRRRRVFSAREDIGEDGIGVAEEVAAEDEVEPSRAFEDILADIPDAVPEEGWEEESDPIELSEEHAFPHEDREPEETIVIEDAEFETIEEEIAEDEPQAAPTVEAPAEAPLADLSLKQLEDRLATALDSRKQAAKVSTPEAPPHAAAEEEAPAPYDDPADSQLDDPDEDDPVIAFLRREASRKMPEKTPEPPQRDYDAQAALREALDKLGRVGKPGD